MIKHPPSERIDRLSALIIFLLLTIALGLAIFLRFYKLNQIPPGFTFDEASHALDALDVLNGQIMLTSPRLKQTETGYIHLLAVVFALNWVTPLAQRVLTATWSILTIPISFLAVWVLLKEVQGQKAWWTALFTALLMATSFWNVLASRIGYEYIFPSFFACMAIIFFWWGYPTERWGLLVVAAICTALNFYFYVGSAPFLLVIPFAVLVNGLINRVLRYSDRPIRWKGLSFFSLIVGSLALPLFLALTTGPKPEVERTLSKLVVGKGDISLQLQRLIESIIAHAQPFLALGGDTQWLNNLPGRPILDPILAISFVAGLVISLKRIKHLPYLFLLIYWAATLAPSVLTFSQSANYFRMASTFLSTYIIISIVWADLYTWLTHRLVSSFQNGWSQFAPLVALIPFLLISLVWLPRNTYHDYFDVWANQPETAQVFDDAMFKFMERMNAETDPEAVFLLRRQFHKSPQPGIPRPDYVLDYLYHGRAPVIYLNVDGPDLRAALTKKLAGYRTIHLVDELDGGREHRYRQADGNDLLPFLFEKYGKYIGKEKHEVYTLLTYQLSSNHTNFEAHLQTNLPLDFIPLTHTINNQIKLAGIRLHPLSKNNLQLDLAWQPLFKTSTDYTVFVQLLDSQGERKAGVDILPERGFSTLDENEMLIVPYTIPLTQNLKPGSYTLLVGLYFFVKEKVKPVGTITLSEPELIVTLE